MRVEKTIKNIKIAMLYQLTILLFTFIDKKVFLSILGIEHAGLHGLFTNMIAMLSLAELGVGIAIIYNLYKPLERQDKEEVSALMKFYKSTYYKIGIAIGVIGSVLAIALPLFINNPTYGMGYIRGIYFIFLMGTVFTYFTGYKRSLLYADQKNYLLLIGDMSANTIGVFLKLWILLKTQNYAAYVLVHVIFKVAPNIWASYKVDQLYPYLKQIKTTLPKEKLKKIKSNVKNLFIHKMSNFVMMATDNLIISSFIGLNAVGLVASYNMIVAALTGFIGQAIEGIQASMGNLVAAESKEKVKNVFDKLTFGCFWIASFCAVSLVCLVQPFIKIWLGTDFLLPNNIVMVIILNLFLWIITRPLWQMMTVTGLFKEEKLNSVVEIIAKLVISIWLVQKIGIIGVFMGTTVTYIIAWLMKSYFLYTRFFKRSFWEAYVKLVLYLVIAGAEVIAAYKISRMIPVGNEYLRFMMQMIVCVMVPNMVNYALFFRTKEFSYFRKLVGDMVMKVLEKLGEEKNKLIIQSIVFDIVAILMFFLPLERTLDPGWRIFGKVPALVIMGMTNVYIIYLLLVPDVITQKAKKIIWIYAGCALGVTVISLFRGGMVGAKAAVIMVLMLNVGLAMAHVDYRKLGRRIYLLDIGILVYIGTIARHYIKLEAKQASYYFIYDNPNYLGLIGILIIFMCLLAYGISREERYFIYPMAFIPIINLSKGRASMLALTVALIVFILWKIISKYKAGYYAFFALVIGGLMIVTLAYPVIDSLAESKGWDQEKIQTIGSKLYSNRETLWVESIEISKEKPILGHGIGTTLESVTQTEKDLSTHNIYVQIFLESGIVGVLLFLTFLGWVWKTFYKATNNGLTRAGVSALIGILMIGIYELTLLGQSISLGIIQWLIIGVALSPALYKYSDTKDIKELN